MAEESGLAGTVLFVSHDASRTGAPIHLLQFLRWFRENRQASFRVLVRNSGDLISDFESLGRVDTFEPRYTTVYRTLRRLKFDGPSRSNHLVLLRKRLMASNIRLVYSNTMVNGEILDFLSFLNCPVLCHAMELESTIEHFGPRNISLVKKNTSSYIAFSQAVKRNLIEKHGIPEDRIRMVYGFIPIPRDSEANANEHRATVRREFDIPALSKVVCACGSIEPRKGTDLFLQVAEKVSQRWNNGEVHFLWVGGSPDAVDRMRKEVKSSPVSRIVHFVGSQPDATPYYDASDVFLLPSREEALGLVMLEAALREKPTICFDNSGGPPEFVEEDAGFVVPGFDVDAMAEKALELLASDSLRRRFGANARQKVLSRHDLNAGASQITRIIQDALSTFESHRATKRQAGIGDESAKTPGGGGIAPYE